MEVAEENYERTKKLAIISARLLYEFAKKYGPAMCEKIEKVVAEFNENLTAKEHRANLSNACRECNQKIDSLEDFLTPKEFSEFKNSIARMGEFNENFSGNTLSLQMLSDRLSDIKNNIDFSSKEFRINPDRIRCMTIMGEGYSKKDNFLDGMRFKASLIKSLEPLKLVRKVAEKSLERSSEMSRTR